MLHSVKVRRGSKDKAWWAFSKKSLFKVKSFFYSLACSEGTRFPWKSMWRTQAHSSVAFFAWSAALGKILTLDNLRLVLKVLTFLGKVCGELRLIQVWPFLGGQRLLERSLL
jgi:hypothetical protein